MQGNDRPASRLKHALKATVIAAGLTVPAAPAAARPQPPVEDPSSGIVPTGAERLADIMKFGDVIIADPDHRAGVSLYKTLASPPFIQAFQGAGPASINLEMPRQAQADADLVAAAPPEKADVARDTLRRDLRAKFTEFWLNDAQINAMLGSVASLITQTAHPPAGAAPSKVNFVDAMGEPNGPEERAAMKAMGYKGSPERLASMSPGEFEALGERLARQHPERVDNAIEASFIARLSPEVNKIIQGEIDRKSDPAQTRFEVYGIEHARQLQQLAQAEGRRATILVVHESEAAFEANKKYFKALDPSLDFSKMNNWLGAEQRFADDPVPAPQTAPSNVRRPANTRKP